MNLDLKSDKVGYMRGFRRRFVKEETIEVIVPDALPDILRIIDTDGVVLMRSKDAEAGRVSVTGVSELSVLYIPESGGGVRKLSASVPFAASAEGMEITADALITATAELTLADARTVNPRKIVVRAEVSVEAALYTPENFYNSAPAECQDIYFKTESRELTVPAAVNEKTFIFTDELKLPSGSPEMGEILKSNVELKLESVKPVGSKAVLKGFAETKLLYALRDGSELREDTFSSPYSIIVETDAPTEPSDYCVELMLTGTYVNRGYGDDGEVISLEIHAVAQCVSYCIVRESHVTDIYSPKYKLEESSVRYELPAMTGTTAVDETAPVSLPVAERAESVRSIYMRVMSTNVVPGGEGTVFSAVLSATAIYTDKRGEVLTATRKFEVERRLETTGEAEVTVARAGDIAVNITDASIDLRVPLTLTVRLREDTVTEEIDAVEYDPEETLDLTDRPSLVVVRAGSRSLWTMAKDYFSTETIIREVNSLEEGAEPEPGAVLLIPRCV